METAGGDVALVRRVQALVREGAIVANDDGLEAGIQRIIERIPHRLIEDLRDYAAHRLPTTGWTPEVAAQAVALADALADALAAHPERVAWGARHATVDVDEGT